MPFGPARLRAKDATPPYACLFAPTLRQALAGFNALAVNFM
jgi:hypothetical protein